MAATNLAEASIGRVAHLVLAQMDEFVAMGDIDELDELDDLWEAPPLKSLLNGCPHLAYLDVTQAELELLAAPLVDGTAGRKEVVMPRLLFIDNVMFPHRASEPHLPAKGTAWDMLLASSWAESKARRNDVVPDTFAVHLAELRTKLGLSRPPLPGSVRPIVVWYTALLLVARVLHGQHVEEVTECE
ncbi:uncharacterized protein AMSG_06511 [Thecamonas trahens ATCC 50062]|uniref:Uncharacterized protein n=1 Tax=Thecamonas trahens ATCC 50062 TaxID=461836 RepID=A0A0L0DG52_THETB|nr:hypothetical protein AMSG_06511 [Thecamonas trahens ATCC 50062]KNC51160.1 hypothetical protein AMSG_06511 [Thecamonas trahens ATCC 50062]|eukprot:XP_013756362.1 hypothetical protein AMSG_06511 [Thecamonas trahens ATCC 50062]